jgi:phage shock protein A
MTSILRRIVDLIRGSLNSLIDRAEDPEKMLEQMMRDMQSSYDRSKVEVARVLAEKHRIQAQMNKTQKEAEDWERKAILALKAGDEGLARKALERKRSAAEVTSGFHQQYLDQVAAAEKLKEALHGLENKIAEARVKRSFLSARHQRALAQRRIHKALSDSGSSTAFDNLARLESKIESLEAETSAAAELTGGTLEDKFRQLGAGADVEDDLLMLKTRMGAAGSLPAKQREALPPAPE